MSAVLQGLAASGHPFRASSRWPVKKNGIVNRNIGDICQYLISWLLKHHARAVLSLNLGIFSLNSEAAGIITIKSATQSSGHPSRDAMTTSAVSAGAFEW